ncbi:MFS transporter [Acetobacterium woodii]|uniref:Sugar/cation symporter n=1 Tax=Acetobacterium woodii (strain ATCC 29683 / DSM 1030 / JCM 2381 / KCTC 1655 / WB1) TaxID=931626 RepID=H6LGI4_ACEWD|nr:glycoside-pentoside-hexuronide (GPH):cation symporter [Acetobacterium woodii]AFA48312.1 sugar/cation symporter [Acetobacterium woodii DSM 1030]
MAEKLKKRVIYLYGLPSFGFQIFIYVELMFFSAFLTDAIKMPVALAGSVLMITSIFDLLWVPVAGIILQKSNLKWGKFRSWLLIGPPVAAMLYILQFLKIGDSMTNAITACLGFIIGHLVFDVFYSAHIAMNSALSDNVDERVKMSANRGIFNALGSLTFSYVGVKAIQAAGSITNDPAWGYTTVVILVALIMVLCYWIFFYLTKEYAFRGTVPKSQKKESMSIPEILQQLFQNPPLIGLLLIDLGRYVGKYVVLGLSFYYFKYVLDDLPGMAIFMTGLTMVILISATLATTVSKKIGPHKAYIGALCIFIAGLLITWLVPMSPTAFKIVMLVSFVGYGLPDSLVVAMYASCVDYGEWRTGKNVRGFIMALLTTPIKVGNFIKSVIITTVLASAGYIADMSPTPQLIQGIKNGFCLYPALVMIFGLIVFIVLSRKMKDMENDIVAKKLKEV